MDTDKNQQHSRFAELAIELLGAKTGADFLAQVWEQASPIVKQRLADALAEKLLALVANLSTKSGSFEYGPFHHALNRIVEQEAMKVFEEKKANIDAQVQEIAKEKIGVQVAAAAARIAEAAARNVGEYIREQLDKAFRR